MWHLLCTCRGLSLSRISLSCLWEDVREGRGRESQYQPQHQHENNLWIESTGFAPAARQPIPKQVSCSCGKGYSWAGAGSGKGPPLPLRPAAPAHPPPHPRRHGLPTHPWAIWPFPRLDLCCPRCLSAGGCTGICIRNVSCTKKRITGLDVYVVMWLDHMGKRFIQTSVPWC